MRPAEIREMSDADLSQKLKDGRAELFNLRFRLATGQLDNPGTIAVVKRDIARLLTESRTREIRAAESARAS